MIVAVMVDWTQVLITGVPATIAAVFAGIATVIVALNRRALRVPSGGTIGEKIETTYDLATTHTAHLKAIRNGGGGDASHGEADAE